ncbi:response regulator transcription factor [Granulicella mallensis]|jgi:two-component system copper resistance phosphate regulon response regulator CusR|uniref:Two component transcriptional regulator, winged helix family n=1 Tax=Granulicella mallensis (strain ATCC BAA-1857 / DSM 23137 / MP5ACTX8) TaxID=682795 RepID=G8NYB7_GRAMM|nr:response regulator transcription factor [Granulicella mallensis]AEU37883.1 two component transcriptional regulator, winged helix family [Granulicella mallensis MP5ACTX8]
MNILVVEDNKRIGNILRQGLVEDGHQVVLSQRGDEGRDLLISAPFDVAVLDVMLPGLDGFSVLEQVRAGNCTVPVLMLTAKDTMPDIVHGLNLGADDYLTKPFQIQVFIARIRALGRRGPVLQTKKLITGDLELDTVNRSARRGSDDITLTKKEYAILELLMRRVNQVVTRNQLREVGWSYDAEVSDSSVDFYMHSLRSKIDIKGHDSLIRTVRSLGYSMVGPK